jgi:hypothetical protein
LKEYDIKVKEPIGSTFIVGGRLTRTPFEARVGEKELELIKNRLRACNITESGYEINEIINFNNLTTLDEIVKEEKEIIVKERKPRKSSIKTFDLTKITNPKFDPINDIDPDIEKKEEVKEETLQRLLNNDFEEFGIEEL